MKKKITFISDTHNRHNHISSYLPGGDLLICAGDMTSMGHEHEIINFCKWFDKIDNYDEKIFIAGNHDWGFQDNPLKSKNIVESYKSITYLQDDFIYVGEHPDLIKIYGSPWQPEFRNWAFNLPRMSDQLKDKWDNIPNDVDILITHGPAYGYLDKVIGGYENLGCELLLNKIKEIKPKIHVFGHIHSASGYIFDGNTHYINASILNEQYICEYKPLTIEWDKKTNEINFL